MIFFAKCKNKRVGFLVALLLAYINTYQVEAKSKSHNYKSSLGSRIMHTNPTIYTDNRPSASYRIAIQDSGVVLKHGNGPNKSDLYGARDVYVFKGQHSYFMTYDGSGPQGWLVTMAKSSNLKKWHKLGNVLTLGKPGEPDSASASYGAIFHNGDAWHMFYLGTANATPAPNRVPSLQYITMKAKSSSPRGPWRKESKVIPFLPVANSYYSLTASPGQIVKHNGEYMMFFSAAMPADKGISRTLGIARTRDIRGSWRVDDLPALPPSEQIENSSLYYQHSSNTWFMFTNHVGIDASGIEFTDAIWVYWTHDINQWDPANKAVVIDNTSQNWSKKIVGLPSVLRVGNKLAIFYDGQAVTTTDTSDWTVSHMHRDIALAWLQLPIKLPHK